jgi:hypothetical protein
MSAPKVAMSGVVHPTRIELLVLGLVLLVLSVAPSAHFWWSLRPGYYNRTAVAAAAILQLAASLCFLLVRLTAA